MNDYTTNMSPYRRLLQQHQTPLVLSQADQIPRSMQNCSIIHDFMSSPSSFSDHNSVSHTHTKQCLMEEFPEYSGLAWQVSSESINHGHDITSRSTPILVDYTSMLKNTFPSPMSAYASTILYDSDWHSSTEAEQHQQSQIFQPQTSNQSLQKPYDRLTLASLHETVKFGLPLYRSSTTPECSAVSSMSKETTLGSNTDSYTTAPLSSDPSSPALSNTACKTELLQEESPSMQTAARDSDDFDRALFRLEEFNKLKNKPASYARLIFRALMEVENNCMALQDIYTWFGKNTNKVRGGQEGWKNSIRHNLSMNEAFIKFTGPGSTSSEELKKSSIWTLNREKCMNGVDPTTRFRKTKSKSTRTPTRKTTNHSSQSTRNKKAKGRESCREVAVTTPKLYISRQCISPSMYDSPSSCMTLDYRHMSPATPTGFDIPHSMSHDGFYSKPSYSHQELFIPGYPYEEFSPYTVDVGTPFWSNDGLCMSDSGMGGGQCWSDSYVS